MKKTKIILSLLLCSLILTTVYSQDVDIVFPVYDGSIEYLSMRQTNTLYTSAYRFGYEQIDSAFPNAKILKLPIVSLSAMISTSFLFQVITHEEAHRAILTNLNIGSVSQPVFNNKGSAYVKGVTNATLKNLRDTDLPMFIRLHTAGVESDYSIIRKDLELMCFDLDRDSSSNLNPKLNIKPLFTDYFVRLMGLYAYQSSGLYDSFAAKLFSQSRDSIGVEEENELDRDIVGHDIYGMTHHLFHPEAEYKRYISFGELSEEEKNFTYRIGWRTLINFASTIMFDTYNFNIGENMFVSGSAGYCIAPFGDFIDESVFFKYDKYNISMYARQAQNRNTWFPAFGIGLVEYKPLNWLSLTARGHFWIQPENLDFNTTVGVPGGAGEMELLFVFPSINNTVIKGLGLSIGALYKTAGFMPEIESHDAHFRMSTGLVVRY